MLVTSVCVSLDSCTGSACGCQSLWVPRAVAGTFAAGCLIALKVSYVFMTDMRGEWVF